MHRRGSSLLRALGRGLRRLRRSRARSLPPTNRRGARHLRGRDRAVPAHGRGVLLRVLRLTLERGLKLLLGILLRVLLVVGLLGLRRRVYVWSRSATLRAGNGG